MAKQIKSKLAILAILGFGVLLVALTSCVKYSDDGTAAEVNGVKITEAAVNQCVADFRAQANLTSESAWETYKKDNKQTSSSIRDMYLEQLIEDEVYRQIAEDMGFVEPNIELLKSRVNGRLIKNAKPSKDAYNQLLLTYADKLNGSKGYYQLMFKNNEERKAHQTYTQIVAGRLSFQKAIEQRMAEDTDGVNFDYVIYDCMIINPDPCPAVLAGMHPGDISNIVKTKNYIYIFYVVDEISCEVPLTSLGDLSEETQDNLKYYSKIMDQQNIVKQELENYKRTCDITKYACPKDLTY